MPVYRGGRSKLQKLTEDELAAYRADACYEEEHGIEKVRACRICGLCRAQLGSIRKDRQDHLQTEHQLSAHQYHDFCQAQGWGRPATISPHMLRIREERRDRNRPRIQQQNRAAEERRKAKRRREPDYHKGYYAQRLKVRQSKLSEAQRAVMIPCPLCERQGHPEYRFLTLQNHVPYFHEMPWGQFRRQFPDATTIVPERKLVRDTNLAAARKHQFRHRGGAPKKAERNRRIVELSPRFSAGQIAVRMGMTRGAVEKVLRRARLEASK